MSSSQLAVGRKVRTGCLTCKIRRVKCDEEKPACLKCRTTGRTCDGYLPAQIGRATPQVTDPEDSSSGPSVLPAQAPSSSLPGTREEQRCFDYFRQRSVLEFSGYFDSNFWDQLILQVSHDDPAVRHAVIALGSLYEKFDIQREVIRSQAQATVCRQDSIEQYNQALSHLQQNLGDDENRNIHSTLICCVLFIAFETFLGNYDSAGLHLESGLKILHDWQVQQDQLLQPAYSPATSVIEDDLLPVFSRLNLQARSLVDPGLSQHHRFIGDTATKSIPNAFSSLNQSRICLYNLFNATFDFIHSTYDTKESVDLSEEPPSAVVLERDHLDGLMQRWLQTFDTLLEDAGTQMGTRNLRAAMLLKIHHTTATVLLRTSLSSEQRGFDAHLDHFKSIVSLSASLLEASGSLEIKPSFSMDLGIIVPLYLTVVSCRDPTVRRQALSLLSRLSLPRQEGSWNANDASRVGRWVINVEEEGLEEVESAEDVPESSRIQRIDAIAYMEERLVHLRCVLEEKSESSDSDAKETKEDQSPMHRLSYTRNSLFGICPECGMECQSVVANRPAIHARLMVPS